MGLAAKNASLRCELAEQQERQGKRVIEAAIAAAKIRLRPILMTSFAFIFGVLPLAIATGAGANSRVAIGTSVIGGMLTATLLRSEEHTSELQSLMRISYAVFCLKKKTTITNNTHR